MKISIVCQECSSVLKVIDTDQIVGNAVSVPVCFDCKKKAWNDGCDTGWQEADEHHRDEGI